MSVAPHEGTEQLFRVEMDRGLGGCTLSVMRCSHSPSSQTPALYEQAVIHKMKNNIETVVLW